MLPECNMDLFCFWMDLIFPSASIVSGMYKQQENTRQQDNSSRKEKEGQVNACILIALLKDASPWQADNMSIMKQQK